MRGRWLAWKVMTTCAANSALQKPAGVKRLVLMFELVALLPLSLFSAWVVPMLVLFLTPLVGAEALSSDWSARGDHDALFPRAQQDAVLAALPAARLEVYQETGHCPNWERPEWVAADIADFVAGAAGC